MAQSSRCRFKHPNSLAMKKYILGILLCAIALHFQAQVYKNFKANDLNTLLQQSQTDEILKKERACALIIHDLINQHRLSNKRSKLRWNDTLWLAARNQGNYLEHNKQFQHEQTRGKEFFTGISEQERIQFVVGQEIMLQASGENLFSTGYAFSNDHLAKLAFEGWKNSDGHNRNMLERDFQTHAVAVFIGDRNVIITEVLTSDFMKIKSAIYATNDSPLMISESPTARPLDRFKQTQNQEVKAMSTSAMKKELGNVFYYLKVKSNLPNGMTREARLNDHAEKTAIDKLQLAIKDRTWLKSVYQETFYHENDFNAAPANVFQKVFGNKKNKSFEVLFAFDALKYDPELVSTTVYSYWKNKLLEVMPNASKYGYFIALKKKNSHFIVSAVLEVQA